MTSKDEKDLELWQNKCHKADELLIELIHQWLPLVIPVGIVPITVNAHSATGTYWVINEIYAQVDLLFMIDTKDLHIQVDISNQATLYTFRR